MQDTRRLHFRISVLLFAFVVLGSTPAFAAGRGEPGPVHAVRVDHVDLEGELKLLQQLGVDIDAVSEGWSRVYLVEEEMQKLERLGLRLTILSPDEVLGSQYGSETAPRRGSVPAEYHTYETLTSDLQTIAAAHPGITRLISIGQSVQGRELWMMLITDNADQPGEEDEPELAYISSMHGDEVVGKELCFNLIQYLVAHYGTDPRVTTLVDEAEIWIMPSMNPDGTALVQRYNAKGWDLNRNFPDQFVDPVNTTDGRQVETAAVMNWVATRSIDLTANFHGGEIVVNYPLDSNPAGTSTFSPAPAPDHETFVSISRSYADPNIPMASNNSHPAFDDGITNGADWYSINGGMQDWAYVWHGTLEVLIELSAPAKWPAASLLPQYWDENLESLLAFLERGLEGVRGRVTDAESAQPIPATVQTDTNPFPTFTDPDVGDYHRIVLPGEYTLTLSAPGYAAATVPISVPAGPAVRYDVGLTPLPTDLYPTARRVIDEDGEAEPGESVDLAVTLTNNGRQATGVSATLVPTGWFAGVVRSGATYPDIPTGGSGESEAPHFEIAIDANTPAGHKAGFALRWSAEQGSALSSPVFVAVGSPTCGTTASNDVPQPLVDLGTIDSTLDLTADVELSDLEVTVDLTHTYIGDLRVTLISPQGTRVTLHDRSGFQADDIVGTYGVDLTPAQSLETLLGQEALGVWRLEIRDEASGDTGFLNAWSLSTCGRPVEAAPPEMRFRELARLDQGVRLDWWPYPGIDSYRVYRSSDPASPATFVDVTNDDDDVTDTRFVDTDSGGVTFYLVSGVGPRGEGPR